MSNEVNNMFISAIGNKKTKAYKAYFDIGNGEIGVTASYSLEVLKEVVREMESGGKRKLLEIREV